MRLLFWIFVIIVAVVLAAFAVSNRETVSLALWPLPNALALPLYLAILGSALLGFIAGALGTWLGASERRREARRRRRRLAALEHQLAATQAQLPAAADKLPAPASSPG